MKYQHLCAWVLGMGLVACGDGGRQSPSQSFAGDGATMSERDVSFSLDGNGATITDMEILTVPVCGGAVQSVKSATNPAKKVPVCAADLAKYPQLASLSIKIAGAAGERSYRLNLANPATLPPGFSVSEIRKDGAVYYAILDKGSKITSSITIETAFSEALLDVSYTNAAIMSGVTLEKISDARMKVGFTGCATCVRVGGTLPVGVSVVAPESAGSTVLDTAAAAAGEHVIILSVAKALGSSEKTDVTLTIKITRTAPLLMASETNKVHFTPMSEKGKITAWIDGVLAGSATLNGDGAQLVTVSGPRGAKVVWKNDRNAETFETILDGLGDYDNIGHYVRFAMTTTLEGTLGITKEAEVQFVGVYGGTGSVHVKNLGKPVVLVLTSYDSISWTVTKDSDAVLEAIIVSGYHRSKLMSQPVGTPSFISSYDTGATDKFRYFYAYKDDSEPRYKLTYNGSWVCTSELDSYQNANLSWPMTKAAIKLLTGKEVAGARGAYGAGAITIDSANRSAVLTAERDGGYCYAGMAGMRP